mmetsp:Transcript_89357/g.250048  ORF Transcript_89357/g.250048 Transcript_89357/m.250048 type:complete len:80 (+) Transcript_89357:70-309(+)
MREVLLGGLTTAIRKSNESMSATIVWYNDSENGKTLCRMAMVVDLRCCVDALWELSPKKSWKLCELYTLTIPRCECPVT